jgi:hypothetical protein
MSDELNKDGWVILKSVFPASDIGVIRDFWLGEFKKPIRQRVTWGPYFGQPNTIGYSDDSFQRMFRAADFLWNDPIHPLTRQVGVKAEELKHSTYDIPPQKYYVSTNLYPPDGGFLANHNDGLLDRAMLVLALIPLTFRGTHYERGGLVVWDRSQKRIDVEAIIQPGDVLVYDGSLRHGVEPVYGGVGRMQMHPIPAKFPPLEDNLPALSRIGWGTFLKAKAVGAENALRIRLGLHLKLR